MIPRVDVPADMVLADAGFFETLVAAGFGGDIEGNAAARTVYATDNSIYQITPRGIVFPRGIADLQIIARTLALPAHADVVIAMRGGGTGTNGQALTNGIVVDCTRYMNNIIEIDAARRVARVQAGVVKDQLNAALKPYGLFFAPELSTSNRATIGGMVSTDASGQGSCLYGKTSNHVLGLHVVLADGTPWWSRPMDDGVLEGIKQRDDQIGEIHRVVDGIARTHADDITRVFPKLNRFMTGYDLAHIRRADGRFDLNAVLCGSEGTLALIAEIEVNLLPIPACAALVMIGYDDFNTALEDARNLVALKAASVETVDEKVLGLAKGDIIWPKIAPFFPEHHARGISIVEILADDAAALAQNIADFEAGLAAHPLNGRMGHSIAYAPQDIAAIWAMRKRAVGLLGNVEGPVRPVPFVEDTAVPPEHLAAYIREFRALLDAEGLDYGMFGHVDAGVLHVRPALDLARPDYVPLVRRVTDGVVALTRRYGGVLWGEHGKGVRSEYVPEFFGPLYTCLQDIKGAFDPRNQFNPGKIAAPRTGALTKIDEAPLRGAYDRALDDTTRNGFDNATYCNGNGACFDFDAASVMCPSYKATRDRRWSPKGRASLVRAWLQGLSHKGVHVGAEIAQARGAPVIWRWVMRAWHSVNPANRHDYSHEVRAAMDTCLACKACAGGCPVKVNVPAFRAKFLSLYYGRYLRPIKDPIVAGIEHALPWLARIRPLYNAGIRAGFGRLFGLVALPRMQKAVLSAPVAKADTLMQLDAQARARVVVFVQDAFTTHFDPKVLEAAITLARKMGFTPYVSAGHINGKALHVHGYLKAFERTAVCTAQYLHALSECGVALVGIDPSMTLTYRDEYAGIASAPKLNVLLMQEWLAQHLDALPTVATTDAYILLTHCTERTNAPAANGAWAHIFAHMGVTLMMPEVGCCGMAGTFGYERRNRTLSDDIYALSWAGIAAQPHVMATGYSCRAQVRHMADTKIPHPIEVINALVRD